MALAAANTTASATVITPNALSALNGAETYAFASKPDVFSNTVGTSTALFPSNHVTNPGVFTQGTAAEGTITHTTLDSNG